MDPFSPEATGLFGLVLARVSAVFVVAPVLGGGQAPGRTRIGLAVMLALVFTPLQSEHAAAVPEGTAAYAVLVGREALIGLIVGFAAALIFQGVQMAAQLIGVQIGFGMGGVLNPETGMDSSVINQFYTVLATVIFLLANGHHAVLAALARTFAIAPVADPALPAISFVAFTGLLQAVFLLSLRLVLPVMGALLLADVVLGLLGRAAPQMDMLGTGAPAKIIVGIVMIAVSTPTTVMIMRGVFRGMDSSLLKLLGG